MDTLLQNNVDACVRRGEREVFRTPKLESNKTQQQEILFKKVVQHKILFKRGCIYYSSNTNSSQQQTAGSNNNKRRINTSSTSKKTAAPPPITGTPTEDHPVYHSIYQCNNNRETTPVATSAIIFPFLDSLIYLSPPFFFFFFFSKKHKIHFSKDEHHQSIMRRNTNDTINWSRKFQGLLVGFAGGSMIGGVGSVLHARRITPQTLPSAMFMGTIMAVGYAIRS